MYDECEEIRGVVAIRCNVSAEYAVRTGRIQTGPIYYYPDKDSWAEAPENVRKALLPYMRGTDSTWKRLDIEEPTWGAVLRAINDELEAQVLKTLRGTPAKRPWDDNISTETRTLLEKTGAIELYTKLDSRDRVQFVDCLKKAVFNAVASRGRRDR